MQNMGNIFYSNATDVVTRTGGVMSFTPGAYTIEAEGIYVGYRYYETRYNDCVVGRGNAASPVGAYESEGNWDYSAEVTYGFGFGLTYGKAELRDLRCDGRTVTVTAVNTGTVDTDEVVQVYVRDRQSPFEVKNHRLCAFRRIHLKAGESAEYCLPLDTNSFTVVDDAGRRVAGSGDYRLWAGFHQPDAFSEKLSGTACLSLDIRQK